MTIKQMAYKLNMTPEAMTARLRAKNIFIRGHNFDYKREVFLEVCHEKYSQRFIKKTVQEKIDLDIIDLYFTSKDNRISVIAEKLGVGVNKAQYVINKFLKNKEIIVESKINYD